MLGKDATGLLKSCYVYFKPCRFEFKREPSRGLNENIVNSEVAHITKKIEHCPGTIERNKLRMEIAHSELISFNSVFRLIMLIKYFISIVRRET
ncbi:hypothetical protein Y032_0002g842 [Ancylostoma ceylanicum]|uniref:Uncharacterized protein n=1 Tax=Ancylostoma ceylanicum TaxID=53326 RepID=A0A016W119_9BILA|nr:hypothetical protein Y032_0002g842 [Ancylostoma ceylanicum]